MVTYACTQRYMFKNAYCSIVYFLSQSNNMNYIWKLKSQTQKLRVKFWLAGYGV